MKKQIVLAAIVLLSCFGYGAHAQVSVHFNLETQPVWGPAGYTYAQYYYIPDIDAYYDVANRDYVYLQDGQWVTTSYLPPVYANYDMARAYKVVINQPRPWLHHDRDWNRYYSYRGRHQELIRDSRDHRYWANPEHPMHGQWHGEGYGHERQGEWGGNRPHGDYDHGHGRYENHDNGRGHEMHEDHDNGRGHGDHDRR